MSPTQIVDIEPELKTFLAAGGITARIFLQDFGRDAAAALPGSLVVRREGSGPAPLQLQIDLARVIITARTDHPRDSFDLIQSVIDLVHRFGPGKMGTLDILHAELSEGPFRDDDSEKRIFQHTAIFLIRAKAF